MKALIYSNRSLELRHIEEPYCKEEEGEALVMVSRAGMCGTDLAIASGRYKTETSKPLVLGHEIFGKVFSLGFAKAFERLRVGSRVVPEINISCDACPTCLAEFQNHCEKIETLGTDRDGGFAEFVSVPEVNLHIIPKSISEDEAVFVKPLAAAIELTKMGKMDDEKSRGTSYALIVFGAILAAFFACLSYLNLTVTVYGINTLSIALMVSLWIIGALLYLISKAYQKIKGVGLSLVFKELPPE